MGMLASNRVGSLSLGIQVSLSSDQPAKTIFEEQPHLRYMCPSSVFLCDTVVRLEQMRNMLASCNEQIEVFPQKCYHQTCSVRNPRALHNKSNWLMGSHIIIVQNWVLVTAWLMNLEGQQTVSVQCDHVACGFHLSTQEGKCPIGVWIPVMGEKQFFSTMQSLRHLRNRELQESLNRCLKRLEARILLLAVITDYLW